MIVNQFPDRIIEIDNQSYLYFGGTSYLGLATHPEFQDIVIKNIRQWGTAYGSSRNANIELSAYKNGEDFLSGFIKSEAALTVSSGMLAGKLVVEMLTNENNSFFHFPNTHQALKALNSEAVLIDNQLNPRLKNSVTEEITILADAVPSFQISPIDLSILQLIPSHKTITLVIDESHSFGILGKNGCGCLSKIDFPNIKRKIMVASLGKAFGLTGGVIASDAAFIVELKQMNSFVSSAGMNAAFVQTMADAASIYTKQHQKLKENLAFIESILKKKDSTFFNPNYPVIYPTVVDINKILEKNKIIMTNFEYPTDPKILNRIVITANHQKEDLDKMVKLINEHQF